MLTAGIILSILSFSCGIWYASFYGKPNKKRALAVKTAASLCFVALGALACMSAGSRYGGTVLVALIIGAVADVVLGARFIFRAKKKTELFFLLGAGLFAAGHIAYIVAFDTAGAVRPLLILAGVALGCAVLAGPLLLKKVKYGRLKGPVFGYGAVLGVMLVCAIGYLAGGGTCGTLVLAAAVLFAISDMLLLFMTVAQSNAAINYVNLATYYAAQILFAWSVLLSK